MPRTKDQFQEIKDNRRAEILKASLPLFALQGYDAVKIDDITNACGCSHGLFYHYFSSKEDLFKTMMDESKAVGKRCYPENWLLDKGPEKAVIHFVDNVLYLLKNDMENCCYMYLYLTMHYQKTLPPPKTRDKKHKYFPELLLEIIKQGQLEHTFNEENPHELIHVFLSLLRGLFYERLQSGKKLFHCPNKNLLLRVLLKDETIRNLNKEVL